VVPRECLIVCKKREFLLSAAVAKAGSGQGKRWEKRAGRPLFQTSFLEKIFGGGGQHARLQPATKKETDV